MNRFMNNHKGTTGNLREICEQK